MSLRSKIVLLLSVVIGLYAATDFAIQRTFVTSQFVDLEQARAQKTTIRAKDTLELQLQLLGARCDDWTRNAETIAFLAGAHPDFEAERLGPELLELQGVDAMYLCDAEGEVLWGALRDPGTGLVSAELELAALPSRGKLSELLLTGWREEDRARGLLRPLDGYLSTELGPLLVSSKPVRTESSRSRVVGKVVLGSFLAGGLTKEIQDRTEATGFKAWFFDESNASPEERAFVAARTGEPLIRPLDDQWLEVLQVVDAQVESRPLVIRAEVERQITMSGAIATRYAMVSTIAAALVLLLVLLSVLQRAVVEPISSLTRNAAKIGSGDTDDVRFDLERSDEVGVLSRAFDNMMEQLAISRAALVDSARQAGQSEIATGILHNVGNVLNSVNVSSGILAKQAAEIAADDLEALNKIIAEHADDLASFLTEDPRGKHFPPFLDALSSQISNSRATIADEVSALTQGIERIRSMVSSQQDYVRRNLVEEQVSVAAQIEKALELSQKVEPFDRELEVCVDLAELPQVPLDRHRLLEILVNLIQNARQAMEGSLEGPRVLTIQLQRASAERLSISVMDTGCGIDEEGLRRVFDHGYTTKPTGNGFGLHSAILAAGELGGALTVTSDGPGRGATFTLELPLRSTSPAI